MAIRKDPFILISLSLPRSTVLSAAFLMVERFFFPISPWFITSHSAPLFELLRNKPGGFLRNVMSLTLGCSTLLIHFWFIWFTFFSLFLLHSGCRQDAVADDRVRVKRRRRMDGTVSSNLHIDEVTDSIRNLPILKGLWTELCQICRAHEGCWDKMKKRRKLFEISYFSLRIIEWPFHCWDIWQKTSFQFLSFLGRHISLRPSFLQCVVIWHQQ